MWSFNFSLLALWAYISTVGLHIRLLKRHQLIFFFEFSQLFDYSTWEPFNILFEAIILYPRGNSLREPKKEMISLRFIIRDRLQISLLTMSEFKCINWLLIPLKSSENLSFSDHFRGNKNWSCNSLKFA